MAAILNLPFKNGSSIQFHKFNILWVYEIRNSKIQNPSKSGLFGVPFSKETIAMVLITLSPSLTKYNHLSLFRMVGTKAVALFLTLQKQIFEIQTEKPSFWMMSVFLMPFHNRPVIEHWNVEMSSFQILIVLVILFMILICMT